MSRLGARRAARLAALLLYLLGYGFFRLNHQIVHRIAGVGGAYTLHAVEGGDAALLGGAINAGVAALYAPPRLLELAYWQLAHPLGSPMTAAHRERWERGY